MCKGLFATCFASVYGLAIQQTTNAQLEWLIDHHHWSQIWIQIDCTAPIFHNILNKKRVNKTHILCMMLNNVCASNAWTSEHRSVTMFMFMFHCSFYCICSCYLLSTQSGVRCLYSCYMTWAFQWLRIALSKGPNRVSPSPVYSCYMTWAVQWLRIALSKGPNRAGVPFSPHRKTETYPVSGMLCLLVI
jgi:hypothetical protein